MLWEPSNWIRLWSPYFGRAILWPNCWIDIPINRYSHDSYMLLNLAVERGREDLPRDVGGPLAPDVEIYLMNVSLDALPDDQERGYFMRIPTTLFLADQQVERLELASAGLIHESPEFQRLIRDLKNAAQ